MAEYSDTYSFGQFGTPVNPPGAGGAIPINPSGINTSAMNPVAGSSIGIPDVTSPLKYGPGDVLNFGNPFPTSNGTGGISITPYTPPASTLPVQPSPFSGISPAVPPTAASAGGNIPISPSTGASAAGGNIPINSPATSFFYPSAITQQLQAQGIKPGVIYPAPNGMQGTVTYDANGNITYNGPAGNTTLAAGTDLSKLIPLPGGGYTMAGYDGTSAQASVGTSTGVIPAFQGGPVTKPRVPEVHSNLAVANNQTNSTIPTPVAPIQGGPTDFSPVSSTGDGGGVIPITGDGTGVTGTGTGTGTGATGTGSTFGGFNPGFPTSPLSGINVGNLLGATNVSALTSQLNNIFGSGVGDLLVNFLTGGAGFNPDVNTALTNAFIPYTEEGMQQLGQAFGSSGAYDSSASALGQERFLRDVYLGDQNIIAGQYSNAVDRYSGMLQSILGAAEANKANQINVFDILNGVLGNLPGIIGVITGHPPGTVPTPAPGGTRPPVSKPGTPAQPAPIQIQPPTFGGPPVINFPPGTPPTFPDPGLPGHTGASTTITDANGNPISQTSGNSWLYSLDPNVASWYASNFDTNQISEIGSLVQAGLFNPSDPQQAAQLAGALGTFTSGYDPSTGMFGGGIGGPDYTGTGGGDPFGLFGGGTYGGLPISGFPTLPIDPTGGLGGPPGDSGSFPGGTLPPDTGDSGTITDDDDDSWIWGL